MDGTTCYSNNQSNNDFSGPTPYVHNEIGGDDMICFNNKCAGGDSTASGDTGSGDICGAGQGYDKYACSSIANSGDWYYNPTAYNPAAALEQTNSNFSVKDRNNQEVRATGNSPLCNLDHHWSCPNTNTVVLFMNEGANYDVDPFTTTEPKQILATTDNTQASTTSNQGSGGNGNYSSWNYPPTYTVACHNLTLGCFFPCSDQAKGNVNQGLIITDWLSGDVDKSSTSGHLTLTFANETTSQPHITQLFGLMLGLGYLLITPVIVLIGYQLLWASWTLRHAGAMEAFGRLILRSWLWLSVTNWPVC